MNVCTTSCNTHSPRHTPPSSVPPALPLFRASLLTHHYSDSPLSLVDSYTVHYTVHCLDLDKSTKGMGR